MPFRKIECLSIWEVGHRWQGVDPNTNSPNGVPIDVQDRLRGLAHAATGTMNAYDAHGEIIPMEWLWFGLPKTSFAKRLDQAVHDPVGQKELLLSAYLHQTEVMKWCFGTNVDLPEFWFEPADFEWQRQLRGDSRKIEASPPKLRPDQEDKARCQAIAKRLWSEDEYKDMTIADMTKRREILIDGNGKAYSGKNTLRNWLKEVAPPAVRKRRGRPKKAPPVKKLP